MKKFILIIIAFVFSVSLSYGQTEKAPKIKNIVFGSITIDGIKFDKDVVIEKGEIRQRKKGPSKNLKTKYNHTPLTEREEIPWDCDTLIIGIGMHGSLPVTDEFKKEAERRGVKLILLKTPEAAEYFMKHYSSRTNAIIHITC